MIKRILIPLDATEYTDTAIAFGCFVAKYHDAEITGLAVLDIPGIERSVSSVPMGGMYYAEKLEKSKEEEAKTLIRDMVDNFEHKCNQAGVRYRRAERQGNPSNFITEEARFYDVMVMGMRPHFSFKERTGSSDLFDVLDGSTTPLYAVPKTIDFPDLEKEKIRTVIAYDGSDAATRALQRFALLAAPEYMDVTLLTADKDKDHAMFMLEEAAKYLNAHGIEDVKTVLTEEDIRDELTDKYMDEYHLFVLGAQSKSNFGRFFSGSLTKRLLEADKRPVLIAH